MNESKVTQSKFTQAILTGAQKFQSNKMVRALTGGMMGVLSLMMISAVATLIGAIDFWGIGEFLVNTGIKGMMDQIVEMTNGVVAIYVAFMVAYKLGEIYKTDEVNCGIMGLMAFLILTPLAEDGNVNISSIGSSGIFVAMFSALLAGRLYIFLIQKKIMIRMPESVPPIVSKSFSAIIPGCVIAGISGIIYSVMAVTPFGSLSNMVYTLLQKPLLAMGSNVFTAMFIVAFIEFLWFFGMHGVMVCMPVLMMLFYEPQLANLSAYNAGEALPYIFTLGFILGNRGARSFAVVLHCFFTCKSEKLKAVGKVGLIPALFGISEPVKFGIPQVMNIRMLIPLMVTPAVSVLSAYLLTVIGFLPYSNGIMAPTGFPIIFSGMLSHGWQGIIAQLIQLALCFVIYIPFMRAEDRDALAEEAATKEELA